jgi:hypothetical protein
MFSRKVFWLVTVVLAVVSAASGVLLGNSAFNQPVDSSQAAWKEVFDSPSRLTRGVDAVVLAKAVSVEPGRIAYSSNREDSVPFEVVQFEVIRGLKGANLGERVSVERAAGNITIDGGAYEMGATYLLFLKQQEEGPYFYQVNHQGRYLVDQGRLYAAAPEDSVASFFEGRPVAEGLGLVRGYLREN